jgi:K+-transporting ATPase A subunit
MTVEGWAQLLLLIALVGLTAPLLGRFMASVLEGGPSRLDRFVGPVERGIYRVAGVDPQREQRWNVYTLSLLAFSAVSFLVLYGLQLAELRPRDDDEPLHAVARAHRAELRVGGSRDRGDGSAHPRSGPGR